jgi:hypothetical protein
LSLLLSRNFKLPKDPAQFRLMVGSGLEVQGWPRARVFSSVELQGFRVVRGVGKSRKRLAQKNKSKRIGIIGVRAVGFRV